MSDIFMKRLALEKLKHCIRTFSVIILQWNSSIAATLGGNFFGRYIGVAFIKGLYTNCSFGTWIPGRYTEVTFIHGWPLRGVPLYM